MIVHVVGASGRSGTAICAALQDRGTPIVPVLRNPAKRRGAAAARVADLTDQPALDAALQDADVVVSCAHARHIPAILAAAGQARRFVFLGSTRKFTAWPDAHGDGVLAGERAFLASGRPGVLLHPTMIYGAEGEDNVQRLAALLRRLPLVPLPGGGRALVQPIHQSDLTRCVLAAVDRDWAGPQTMAVAGPEAVSYAAFVREVARAAAIRAPLVLPIPVSLLLMLAPLTALPGLPRIRAAELRRLSEDKAFPIADMQLVLGVQPMSLLAGLTLTFGPAA